MRRRVLISWIAVNNDPFERDRTGNAFRLVEGSPVPGPSLTLLFDADSPYAGSIADVVLFHSLPPDEHETRQSRAFQQTVEELHLRDPGLRIHSEPWDGDDPTDHVQLFDFLREKLPAIRRKFADRELILHVSPGTPSMQTVLVLMGETGFIDPPFVLVKSYRKEERNGRPAVVPVQLGIDSYYKAYRAARPSEVSSEDAAVVWDPARFKSSRMREIFDEARRFAQLNVPVLLLGERGTGKTTLAGWIRSHSPYRVPDRDGHWPAVACGQYNPETMRAELFGYKRGSFTGALKDHEGLLAVAHKDTLFLDEIGDVGRDLQRLLIKAVEEKRYMRLGDDRQLTSDFRLISATNLPDEKLRERLDPDFFDRISMLTLRMPPLARDSGRDLMALGNGVCAGGASGRQWPRSTSSQRTPGDRRPTVAASASRQPAGLVPCGVPNHRRQSRSALTALSRRRVGVRTCGCGRPPLRDWRRRAAQGRGTCLRRIDKSGTPRRIGRVDQYEGGRESFQGLLG
jgi:hypothetical protein